jgi:hypothetical protein
MQSLRPEQQWLLDRAAEFFPPVCLLLRNFIDLKSQWNCSFPNWKNQEMFAALRQLEDDCLIEFFQRSTVSGSDVCIQRPELQAKQIVADYRANYPICYRLTASGGERWEQVALPDWAAFYRQEYLTEEIASIPESDRPELALTLYAMSDEFARLALLALAESHNLLLIPGTENFSPCGPWQATYWKTLPGGIKVTAAACYGGPEYPLQNQLPDKWMRLAGEAMLRWSRWYTKASDASFCRDSDPQWLER